MRVSECVCVRERGRWRERERECVCVRVIVAATHLPLQLHSRPVRVQEISEVCLDVVVHKAERLRKVVIRRVVAVRWAAPRPAHVAHHCRVRRADVIASGWAMRIRRAMRIRSLCKAREVGALKVVLRRPESSKAEVRHGPRSRGRCRECEYGQNHRRATQKERGTRRDTREAPEFTIYSGVFSCFSIKLVKNSVILKL